MEDAARYDLNSAVKLAQSPMKLIAIALLKSAARELDKDALTPDRENAIGLREARYVLLLEQPELIKLLPSEFTSMLTLAYDPLPPEDSPMR